MRLKKLSIVLLALLLAAMAMVPMVSAEDEVSADTVAATNQGMSDPMQDPEIVEILKTAETRESLPASLSGKVDKKTESYLNDYTSPSQQLITVMKTKKYSNDQITKLLENYGYGWNPQSGSTWKGTAPTKEEQIIIDQIRGPAYSPDWSSTTTKSVKATREDTKGGAVLAINDENTYFGVNVDMSPGPLPVGSTGTFQHVVTTHVGKRPSSGGEDWTEAGATMSVNDPNPRYFTFDNDEGEWIFHGTAGTANTNYQIYVSDNLESYTRNGQTITGYKYNIWIGNSWKRGGHLLSRQTGINCANENWAHPGNSFSWESSHPTFQNGYLYKSTGYQLWGDYPNLRSFTNVWGTGNFSNGMLGGSYNFVSWVS